MRVLLTETCLLKAFRHFSATNAAGPADVFAAAARSLAAALMVEGLASWAMLPLFRPDHWLVIGLLLLLYDSAGLVMAPLLAHLSADFCFVVCLSQLTLLRRSAILLQSIAFAPIATGRIGLVVLMQQIWVQLHLPACPLKMLCRTLAADTASVTGLV
jgi:hypothetical protein